MPSEFQPTEHKAARTQATQPTHVMDTEAMRCEFNIILYLEKQLKKKTLKNTR